MKSKLTLADVKRVLYDYGLQELPNDRTNMKAFMIIAMALEELNKIGDTSEQTADT